MISLTRGLGPESPLSVISALTVDIQPAVSLDITIEPNDPIVIQFSEDGGSAMDSIEIKQGEAKTLTFTITQNGAVVPLGEVELSFVVKESKNDTEYILSKAHQDFDMADAANGIAKLKLSEAETQVEPDTYVAELKLRFTADNIIKTSDIDFVVEKSVFNAERAQ